LPGIGRLTLFNLFAVDIICFILYAQLQQTKYERLFACLSAMHVEAVLT